MPVSPAFRVLNQQENREGVIGRKPVLNSARKPLADKSVNAAGQDTKMPAKSKAFVQQTSVTKAAGSKLQEFASPLLDFGWSPDVCSKKEVPVADTYEDICGKSLRLTDYDFMKAVRPVKTPPPMDVKRFTIDPMVFEIPKDDFFGVKEMTLEELPVEEVELPDFNFDF